MKKLITALLVFGAVVLASLSFSSPAQAYGNDTPPSVSPATVHSEGVSAPTSSVLPNTGGPSVLLLGGALMLIVVGGVVMVARRRTTD